MKRGYMDWKEELLPKDTLKLRQKEFIKDFREKNIDAAVIYADVASADEMQYLTNLGPYWSNASAIFFKDGSVHLVTGLSARVNPWISKLTGMGNSDITSAGPNLAVKIAEVLGERLDGGGVIGLTGQYFPQTIVEALEKKGFETVVYQKPREEQLARRDDAYIDTVKEGIAHMEKAITGALQNPEIKAMTRKRLAAEVEYACRKAGAMDILLLEGDKKLVFDQPQELPAGETPWILYVQIQYLGEWIVLARMINGREGEGMQAAQAARDKAALRLTPGEKQLAWDEDGCGITVCSEILADHLSWQGPKNALLADKQMISLMVRDEKKGIYLEDMYLVSPEGGLHLTSF